MHYLNYEEQILRGTKHFPLEYYAVDEQHPCYFMPFHWHNETELLYVLDGEFKLILDNREYHLHAGDLCYIPSGAMHGGEGIACVYECIVFDAHRLMQEPPVVRQYLSVMEDKNYQIQNLFTRQQSEVLECAAKIFSAARDKDNGWEMLVLSRLYDFFGTVLKKDRQISEEKKKTDRTNIIQINAAIEYISHHYKESIKLEDLARAAALSPQYFCKYFHVVTGKSPVAYLNYYRVERACYLLERKNSTVTEVAMECGFNDVSYFIRCFKKHKGITPYQYIKRMQERDRGMSG